MWLCQYLWFTNMYSTIRVRGVTFFSVITSVLTAGLSSKPGWVSTRQTCRQIDVNRLVLLGSAATAQWEGQRQRPRASSILVGLRPSLWWPWQLWLCSLFGCLKFQMHRGQVCPLFLPVSREFYRTSIYGSCASLVTCPCITLLCLMVWFGLLNK